MVRDAIAAGSDGDWGAWYAANSVARNGGSPSNSAGDWLDRNFGGDVYGGADLSKQIAVGTAQCAPVAGEISDLGETILGYDTDGNSLSATERVITVGAMAIPFVPGGWLRKLYNKVKDRIPSFPRKSPTPSPSPKKPDAPGVSASVAPAKVIDPNLDANILIALSDPKNVNHAAAVKFVTDNQAAGLSASGQAIREMLAKPGMKPADFLKLQKDYGIQVILDPKPKAISDAAARLQSAFTDGRVLRDADARVAAAAYRRGEKLGTADLQFFKRAKDLGLDVEFVGSDPKALAKAAGYVPNTVTIPPP